MPVRIKNCFFAAATCCFLFLANPSKASHILGGDMTYKYLKDTTASGGTFHKYQVTLTIYEDCQNGQPEAISQDNPAYFSLYDLDNTTFPTIDTTIYYSSNVLLTEAFNGPCGYTISNTPPICVFKKNFLKTYYLPPNTSGYVVAYQRCCRSSVIANITDPGDIGNTFFCTIPAAPLVNNSAIFTFDPMQLACINKTVITNVAAVDADGDSLSYELDTSHVGGSDADIKPIPPPPPYDFANYQPGYSAGSPINGTLTIDAHTGVVNASPAGLGRYTIAICCKEWRSGMLINIVRREYILTVLNCESLVAAYHPVTGHDTTIMVGDSVQFSASGGNSYSWSPGVFLTDSTAPGPIGHFPEEGYYTYTLTATNDSGCPGYAVIHINVVSASYMVVPNVFSPNGDGHNDYLKPIPVLNATLKSFKIFNRWGNLVYSGLEGWDGNYKGTKQDVGVFVWELIYDDNQGKSHYKKGNVTLLRKN